MRLTVVTPWHNHRELERDYWAVIRSCDVDVLVIDNGSNPPLPNAWRLEFNSGFSHACNVGLDLARTEAVLFLNNDIAQTTPGDWAAPIVAALEPGVLVGANLRSDAHGAVDGQTLPYLDGWCLAGMTADLIDIGGWDESLEEPSYFGDNLLSLEARAAGMTLREVRVGLHHKANVTAGGADVNVEVARRNRELFAATARELLGLAVAA